jgi:ribosome assembly protein RRB1
MDMEAQQGIKPSVFIPGKDAIEDGETLQYDPSAYDCMSQMQLEWPALSFDVIRDSLGQDRRTFPHTLFMVAGTQASSAKLNYLAVMKVANLSSGKQHGRDKGNESDEDAMALEGESDEEEEEEKEDAVLHVRRVAHTGGINRVRSMPQQSHIVASWSDSAQVQIWDLSSFLLELEKAESEPAGSSNKNKIQKVAARQVHTHSSEGFAVDWSAVHEGRLVSGDCRSKIHVWEPSSGGKWGVGAALKGHEGSVEDLQWSPTEGTVFASASVDRTIRIWDTRETVSRRFAFLFINNSYVWFTYSLTLLSKKKRKNK